MNTNCASIREALVRLAEGKSEPEAESHAAGCARCSERLSQLRAMVSLARVAHFDAPEALVRSAKGLMAPRRRTLVAGLLRSSLSLSGARSLPESAQLVVGGEDVSIRLMVRRQGEGYEVFGELPSSDWTVESDRAGVTQNGSRFQLAASDPADTAFVAESELLRVEVPALQELIPSGTKSAG
ncbi:MAG TPA: hypothetical protein VGE01_05445 [Fimbriimonas sp.]